MVVGAKDRVARSHLNGAQGLPVVAVDEILNERRVAIEDGHGVR